MNQVASTKNPEQSQVITQGHSASYSLIVMVGLITPLLGRVSSEILWRADFLVCIHAVEPDWVAQEKAKAKEEGQVPFISTNDALTSWFFGEVGSDLNIMVANLRSREPSILGLSDNNVGNYEANVPYFPGDVETPALIRQSIRSADGGFRARRAGSPTTEIPGFWTLLHNRSAIITNWATFYHDVNLRGDAQSNEKNIITPKLHLPIMEPDGLITSVWNNAIVFRPRAGELGVLMISGRYDSDMLAQQKAEEGANAPMGARIV